jgi:glycerol-1-phosphate dehydrogenase [NAD(P)+]
MLAKYVSICEWRIAELLVGEPYCEAIASLVRASLDVCVKNARALMNREPEAVRAVFEGLVVCGAAMEFAGLSRPASGVEHYFSHVWDMRGLDKGTKVDLHGIQCALGTLLAARLYEAIKTMTPDEAKAKAYVENFSFPAWCETLRSFVGAGAETMNAQEAKEGKYNKATHTARFEKIRANWDKIVKIIDEEIPSAAEIEKILVTIGIEPTVAQLDLTSDDARVTFQATKDIRDKYVLSRLAWDLGVMDELCQLL